MEKTDIPFEKLFFFQNQLGLGKEEMESLDPHRDLFIAKKEEFASFFYNRLYQMSRTRIILEHEKRRGSMKEVWAHWFESLITTRWDESFLAYLWSSGLKHVKVNLDQSFINLGFCIIRQFCHRLIAADVPLASQWSTSLTINKMLDLCLLVETNAYMVATSYCDREVIKGISHQIRNPITIIGGNAVRIQRRIPENTDLYQACGSIILESMRLERLVKDVTAYLDMFQRESQYAVVSLEGLISDVLGRLAALKPRDAKIIIKLDPKFPDVQGDPKDLEAMFYYLLENSMEALTSQNPYIEIKSRIKNFASYYLEVEVFNTGTLPKSEDIDELAVPFSSSKPSGTGFGLPIARLAANRNLISLNLIPLPEQGTKTVVQIPLPG